MGGSKGSKAGNTHPSRVKKRKFHGKCHSIEQDTQFTSASAKKIGRFDVEVPVASNFGYCIIEFVSVFSALSASVICKDCKSEVTFSKSSLRGLGFNILFECKCDKQTKIKSCPLVGSACEINRRIVFAMRMLGVGHQGLNLFCGLMDICQGIGNSTYASILENIHIAAFTVYDSIISFAATEEKDLNERAGNIRNNLTVSGDGILNAEPYEDLLVIKKECVGHVEKRMGTRLRNAKKNNKGMGGKGAEKLTDKLINELTKFYGLAIRRHSDSVEEMRKEIWATFFHKSSSDENPQHQNCPEGAESWCKWQQAAANGELNQFRHDKPSLTPAVQAAIRPIYEELSKDELLHRCLGSETQNNNASLNSLIWTFAPKHLHSGPKIVEIATFLATAIFNEGFEAVIKIMNVMGCPIGNEAHNYTRRRDKERVARSDRCRSSGQDGCQKRPCSTQRFL